MDERIKSLCDLIRQTAYKGHRYVRHGHLEKVYENALAHRLQKAGVAVVQQPPPYVYDEDGTPLGIFAADLWNLQGATYPLISSLPFCVF